MAQIGSLVWTFGFGVHVVVPLTGAKAYDLPSLSRLVTMLADIPCQHSAKVLQPPGCQVPEAPDPSTITSGKDLLDLFGIQQI